MTATFVLVSQKQVSILKTTCIHVYVYGGKVWVLIVMFQKLCSVR